MNFRSVGGFQCFQGVWFWKFQSKACANDWRFKKFETNLQEKEVDESNHLNNTHLNSMFSKWLVDSWQNFKSHTCKSWNTYLDKSRRPLLVCIVLQKRHQILIAHIMYAIWGQNTRTQRFTRGYRLWMGIFFVT
jgi:hypothetical protein